MELNERQDRFLLEAFKAAPSHGIQFSCTRVGESAWYDADESHDLAQQLADKGLMTVNGDIGHLTPDGREEARVIKGHQTEISVDSRQLGLIGKAYAKTNDKGEFVTDSVCESKEDKDWFTKNGLTTVGPTFGHMRWTPAGAKMVNRLVEWSKKRNKKS